jgi:endonuclease/exonuclease/phosphatase family metal-dependent hydrolase
MRVRVVSFNVWNTEGDAARRIQMINKELHRLQPDLVALTEVVRTSDIDQLPELIDGLDLHASHQDDLLFGPRPHSDHYGGTAIATRWPHRAAEILDQRGANSMDVPWCTIAASVPLPGEGDLLFIASTMSWRLSDESSRERQALALSDLDARHRTALPTVIAGDLNAAPDAACIRYLTGKQTIAGRSVMYHDVWEVAGQGPGYTWTCDNPNARGVIDAIVGQPDHRRRIDYILTGSWDAHPSATCRVERVALAFDQPDDDVWPSDHFGVVADLEIQAR